MGIAGVVSKGLEKEKIINLSKYIFLKEKISIIDLSKLTNNKKVITIIKEVKPNINQKKLNELLLLVGLNDNIFNKKANELSTTETIKLKIGLTIIEKPEVIIFNDIDKFFIEKNKKSFISLIKVLVNKLSVSVVIKSNDLLYLSKICDIFYYVDKEFIHSTDNIYELFFDDELIPDIYSFLETAKIYGHDLYKYTDVKEIIKAIYRGE